MTQARLLGGRYQVGELLGYGGMAEVHRGRDLRLGRDVAIKMLRSDLARDDTFQLRFRREAQNAAALNHPAIVAVYDTGEERGATGESLPYIVMEFVNGRTLKEILVGEGRLMPRRALEITAEICSALEFSHRHGIIHRDIKPGNVMLTKATGQVKVMDFGIARALASGAATMTQTSAVIGTAQYLSPEQARGESVDARSDVYATGCVLYELLCGHPPFVGDSPVSVAYQHVREEPKPPSLHNRDVSPSVDAVVLKSLAKNPANRYQSAAEMRADLLRAAAGRPVYAEPILRGGDPGATRVVPLGQRPMPMPMPMRPAPPHRRPGPNWTVIGLSSVAAAAVIVLIVALIVAGGGDRVQMPSLVGLQAPMAEDRLRSLDLIPHPADEESKDCVAGQVSGQEIPAGHEVAKGSRVTYWVCRGPGQTQVPNVVAMNQEQAKTELTAAELDYEIVEVDSAKPAGEVINAQPPPGTPVEKTSKVVLSVSKGNFKVMPALTGLATPYTYSTAMEMLTNAGFTNVEPMYQEVDNPALADRVLDQYPEPGKEIDPTQRVRITIGRLRVIEPTHTAQPTAEAG